MKKKLITVSYFLASIGLFVLAIDVWICGAQPFCRSQDSVGAMVANAIKVTTSLNPGRDTTTQWSGPDDPNFAVSSGGGTVVIVVPPPPNRDH